MINGYEYLYQEKNGEKPKYELHVASDKGHFAHDIDGSGQKTHLGVSTCEAITNLIEANIGKKFYKEMFKVYDMYTDLYNSTIQYQKDKAKFDEIKGKLAKSKENEKTLLDEKKKIEKQIKDVLNSKDEDKASKVKELNKELKINEKALKVVKTANFLSEKLMGKAEQKLNKNFARLQKLKENLEKAVNAIDMKKFEEIKKKFNSPEFQQQIEQEFVDTMLLPGEEKKETSARHIAKTWFAAFKTEMKYLESIKPVAQNLISNINVQLTSPMNDITIKDDVAAQNKVMQGMKNLSTDIIENSQGRFDSRNYCEFYLKTVQMAKDSNYGKNPTEELINLPEFAISNYGFKNETLDTAKEIFDGSLKMIEGQMILSNENVLGW